MEIVKKHRAVLNDLHDILFNTPFKKAARKRFNRFLKGKEVSTDLVHGTISIGKYFVLKLSEGVTNANR